MATETETDIVDRYIATWNATGEAARALITRTFTPDATYLDPVMTGQGHAGIERLIEGMHGQFPGFRFSRIGRADSHNGRVRFSWGLGPDVQDSVIEGTDFAELAADGRIASIVGFLDRVPAGPGAVVQEGAR